MVTTFAIRRDWKPVEGKPGCVCDPELAPVAELQAALDAHLTTAGLIPDEYGFSGRIRYEQQLIPARYWRLVAFATEGSSEGYYVHIGCISQPMVASELPTYLDFGFCKTYSADNAYAIAREAQRFLTAAEWN